VIETCPYPQPTAETVKSWGGFLYFVWEREAIRLARENGYDKPWTIDPIMEKYRFCNIRRRDDRVSQWLISHIYEQRCNHVDLWFIAAICRLINWPPTLKMLDYWEALPDSCEEFDIGKFVSVIEELVDKGDKVYSGAYMTYPGRNTGSRKSEFFATKILEPLISIRQDVRNAVSSNSVEEVVRVLSSSFGLSTFLAGQVAADLTYFDTQLGKAHDLNTFAPLGPGSQNGLNLLMGNKIGTTWKQGEFNRTLVVARGKIKDKLGIDDLTLHDVQNCFCEYGKMARMMVGGGTPRSLYKPETAF